MTLDLDKAFTAKLLIVLTFIRPIVRHSCTDKNNIH